MIVPFAIGSMIAASQSDKISIRIGRWILVIGCALMAIGLSLVELLLHRGGVTISALTLTAPLFIAGIGNGLFIAPNQDFILKSVKRQDAGSASGIVATAQRIGTAVGIAAIGTIFFSSIKITRQPQAIAHAFSHGAQIALLVNISLSICALILVFSLPKTTAAPQPAAADDA
jgi:sugar phosphate permease